ncbi:MAG: toll/interleukin-1 receptor domain-containing protein, partial [Xanthobacteraceae bacterium]
MSSLSALPDLVGFFSYSREDDQGSRGGLSELRDAIQTELSAQLGRSQLDFRIWQDKAAISLGTLWEKQIKQGIDQSVFFIPIVTPRALRSQNCALEFQSFLARESELGRDDLVFPILYIPVPALEDEKLWRQDPVLNIVGTRQYLDWRELRHHDPRSTEVRLRIERYCRNTSAALNKPWVSLQERKLRDEAEARQRAEEEEHRLAARRETERAAEAERQRRADEEQRARQA